MNWERLFRTDSKSRWDRLFKKSDKGLRDYRSPEDQRAMDLAAKVAKENEEELDGRMLLNGVRSESAWPERKDQRNAHAETPQPNIIETPSIDDAEISDFRSNAFADSYEEIRAPQTLLSDQDVGFVLEWLSGFDSQDFVNTIQNERDDGAEIVAELVERLHKQIGKEVPEHWRDE